MDVKQQIIDWAKGDENIRVVLLSGSRVENPSKVDQFSDYDLAVYVKDTKFFMDEKWTNYFGETMACWPKTPQSTWDKNWITYLVHFKDGFRIDFQITNEAEDIEYDPKVEVWQAL